MQRMHVKTQCKQSILFFVCIAYFMCMRCTPCDSLETDRFLHSDGGSSVLKFALVGLCQSAIGKFLFHDG